MKNWNTTSEHCVGFVSIKKFNRTAEFSKTSKDSLARNNHTIEPSLNHPKTQAQRGLKSFCPK